MRLDEYRAKHSISQDEFGKKLTPPVGQALVSQWERGETQITLTRAVEIQEITGVEVTVLDCADMYTNKKEKAAA